MATNMTVAEIRVSEICADPGNPRKTFPEEPMAALARSLESDGLLQPITVRPWGQGGFDYIIIAGERRWTAAGRLGWETIPAIVRTDVSDAEARRLQLLENIVREDLNPIEEARALQSMLAEGFSLKDIEDACGIAPQQVTWRVDLLKCRQDIVALIASGVIKPGVGHELSRLTDNGQGRALRAMNEDELTFNEVIAMIKGIGSQEAQIDMFPDLLPDPVRDAAVTTFTTTFDQLLRALGRLQQIDNLGKALSVHGGTVEAQLDEATRGLQSLKRDLERYRMAEHAKTV